MSGKINTTTRMASEMKPGDPIPITFLESNSIEHLYHAIRTNVFPSVDTENMKSLFLDLVDVPIRSLGDAFLNELNKKNLDLFAQYVKNNKISGNTNLTKDQLFTPNYEAMFDIYLSIKDEQLAFDVFRGLIFLACETQEIYDAIIKHVMECSEEELQEFGNHTENAEFI
jgi:hypothetical protein